MVVNRNAVNGAMFMIIALLGVAALFMLLKAFFLGILQVMVYAGAVMVLFLFILMLIDVDAKARLKPDRITTITALLCFLALALGVAYVFNFGDHLPPTEAAAIVPALPPEDKPQAYSSSAKSYGLGLFTRYMLPFQVTGFLLLIAMVGVILIGRKPKEESSADSTGKSS